MKILNTEFERDIARHKPLRLELGCGQRRREGFYSLDHIEMNGVDIVADLNKPLSLVPDNSAEYIYSSHVLEHIAELLPLMREIHRITRADGTIEIVVPHFSNVYGHSDPTHLRMFGLYSMHYFVAEENQQRRKVPAFYTDTRFIIKSIRIEFYRLSKFDRLVEPLVTRFVNQSMRMQDFYERRLSHWYHASQIRFVLAPEK